MDLLNGNFSAVKTATISLFASVFFIACNKPFKTISITAKDTVAVVQQMEVVKTAKKKKKKKLYITFDDGPNKGTENVLTITRDEAVPVSFFVVGEHVFASSLQSQLWSNMQSAEHADLCNHSYSHAHGAYAAYYKRPDDVVKDFKRTQDSLQLKNHICRTPGRNIWRLDSVTATDLKTSVAAADSLQYAGFSLMGWDVEWHYDHKTMSVLTSADQMLKNIDSVFYHQQTKRPDHLVLLAHDQVYKKSDDSIQLRHFFQRLKADDNYELSLVTDYPGAATKRGIDSFKIK